MKSTWHIVLGFPLNEKKEYNYFILIIEDLQALLKLNVQIKFFPKVSRDPFEINSKPANIFSLI